MAKTQSSVSVQIDVSAVRKLAVDLRAADPIAAKNLRLGLRAAAEVVAEEARSISGEFSTRIPGSIKASAVGQLSAKVKAGNANAPHAAPIENHGQDGTFRHPVFGDRTNWVNQPAHPYLSKAAANKAPEVEAMVTDAIQEGFRALGLDTD